MTLFDVSASSIVVSMRASQLSIFKNSSLLKDAEVVEMERACDPGSIPGWRIYNIFILSEEFLLRVNTPKVLPKGKYHLLLRASASLISR